MSDSVLPDTFLSDTDAIYIHVPFCIKKCIYCDFYSESDFSLIAPYLNALEQEIENRPGSKKIIQTIYFGGGTPSVLSVGQIEQILNAVYKKYRVSQSSEITVEINPGTVNFAKLKDYRSMGINRLSIGAQSFNDEKLKFLERIHSAAQAVDAIKNAQRAGFENIGLDLIYGLPFESKNQWQDDLNHAVKMIPSHLACYMLTIEPFTPLYRQVAKGRVLPLNSDRQSDMFCQTSLFLTQKGYEHYEISNFAKGTKNRSQHNSSYWQMKSYRGFGAAAHSFDGITRSWNHPHLKRYIRDLEHGRLPVKEKEELNSKQQLIEAVMLGLRTLEGIDVTEFEKRFNQSFKIIFKTITDNVCENNLGGFHKRRFCLNIDGRIRLNSIVEAFVGRIL